MKKNIDIKDIIDWVLENKDNQGDIDMLSHLIYPYTTKYKKYYCRRPTEQRTSKRQGTSYCTKRFTLRNRGNNFFP